MRTEEKIEWRDIDKASAKHYYTPIFVILGKLEIGKSSTNYTLLCSQNLADSN